MSSVKDPEAGKGLGRKAEILRERGYFCRGLLGKGAFSEVYRVEDGNGNVYACKVSGDVRLLEKEARIIGELRHPLFPKFFGLWVQEQWGFLVMEYIPGNSLERMLERRGRFSARQTVRTGMELAEGLAYLHENREKMLFQDVKPANIIVRQDGRVKLLDFGCVCFIGEKRAAKAGTPGYAAPEQLEGKGKLTEACDVYGLGMTLQAMLQEIYGGVSEAGKRSRKRRSLKRRREKRGTSLIEGSAGGWGKGAAKGWGKAKRHKIKGGKRCKRELGRLLEACTRQEAAKRISNMRDVMAALAGLGGAENWDWRREASCRKNIWECMCKKT